VPAAYNVAKKAKASAAGRRRSLRGYSAWRNMSAIGGYVFNQRKYREKRRSAKCISYESYHLASLSKINTAKCRRRK